MKKQVGNAVRTKNQIRNTKAKGSGFEYDCQHSLIKLYPEIWRTAERGYQRQYDLESENNVFECKRLKGISWNQCEKFFLKLEQIANTKDKRPYLLFQSNRQPTLVMYRILKRNIIIESFEDVFGSVFTKHSSTRRNPQRRNSL